MHKYRGGINMFPIKDKEEIQLYCQNPQCKKPLIKEGENIAEVNGSLVHANRKCIRIHMVWETVRKKDIVVCPSINYFPYNEAIKLAEKDKIKYSKLEKHMEKKND